MAKPANSFDQLLVTRRSFVAKLRASAGVTEDKSVFEDFIDHFILEIDDKEENACKKEFIGAKKSYREAGEYLLNATVKSIAETMEAESNIDDYISPKKREN